MSNSLSSKNTVQVLKKNIRKTGNVGANVKKTVFHMKLSPEDIEEWSASKHDAFQYNPNIEEVKPYDENAGSLFHDQHERISSDSREESPTHDKETQQQNKSNDSMKTTHTLVSSPENGVGMHNTTKILETPYYNQSQFTTFKFAQYFDTKDGKCKVPTHTQHCCWWSRNKFTNHPIGIPTKQNIDGSFTVYGNFSSFGCALQYLSHETLTTNEFFSRRALLQYMYNLYTESNTPIHPAPHWRLLKEYGGPLSLADFMAFCHGTETFVSINDYPMINTSYQVELRKNNKMNLNAKKKVITLDPDRVKQATKNVKLRRRNPTTNNVNTLEQCMKLSFS